MRTFCPLPRIDPTEKGSFLSTKDCQRLLEEEGATLQDELKDLHCVREAFNSGHNKQKEKNDRDRSLTKSCNWSKVRRVLTCTECGALRCVFSQYSPGNAKGPKKLHFDALDAMIAERGYACGDLVRVYPDGIVAC